MSESPNESAPAPVQAVSTPAPTVTPTPVRTEKNVSEAPPAQSTPTPSLAPNPAATSGRASGGGGGGNGGGGGGEPKYHIGIHNHEVKWWSESKTAAHLRGLGIKFEGCSKLKTKMYCHLKFNSEESKQAAVKHIESLNATLPSKRKLRIKEAEEPRRDPKRFRGGKKARRKLENKRAREEAEKKAEEERIANGEPPLKKQKPEIVKTIEDQVTPLWKVPYEEQLDIKQKAMGQVLKKWTKLIRKKHREIKYTGVSGQFCPLERIIPSPTTEGYRNKSVFGIGHNSEGLPSVGFTKGRFTDGLVQVESASGCRHIPAVAKECGRIMTDFIRGDGKEFKPYDKYTHEGVYRELTVRNSESTKQVMVVAQLQLDPAKMDEEKRAALKASLKAHFMKETEAASFKESTGGYHLASLQVQLHCGVSNAADYSAPLEIMHGDKYIQQTLLGFKFRVSATSFFQVNNQATEKLYSIVGDWCGLSPNTVVLDICCGAGTIGMSVSKRVRKVVGLEIVESAVTDARHNAAENGVTNCTFLCGKAEDTLSKALQEHATANDEVVAIVDPPRAGLHHKVVTLIRHCPRIKRVVYVACHAPAIAENLSRFIQPKARHTRGEPFIVDKAVPVDLFPHTKHTELVVMLTRSEPGSQAKVEEPEVKEDKVKEDEVKAKEETPELAKEGEVSKVEQAEPAKAEVVTEVVESEAKTGELVEAKQEEVEVGAKEGEVVDGKEVGAKGGEVDEKESKGEACTKQEGVVKMEG